MYLIWNHITSELSKWSLLAIGTDLSEEFRLFDFRLFVSESIDIELGRGSCSPGVGAGLLLKYGIWSAAVVEHRLSGFKTNIFEIKSIKSGFTALKISRKELPVWGLNGT